MPLFKFFAQTKNKMTSVSDLIHLLEGDLSNKNIRQLAQIFQAVLRIGGRVTMLGITRMSPIPYRTLSRIYDQSWDWFLMRWTLFIKLCFDDTATYVLVGDETVEGKAGSHTAGMSKFYSSTHGRPIPGVSMFALSVVEVATKRSYPLCVEQLIETEADRVRKAAQKQQAQAHKGGSRGRKKGTKNCPKQTGDYPLLRAVRSCLSTLMPHKNTIGLKYWALDGYFGHQTYIEIADAHDLFLICKLKRNAVLYFDYQGAKGGRGRPRLYGDALDLCQRYPAHEVKDHKSDYGLVQQFEVRSRTIKNRCLNVVVLYTDAADLQNRTVLFSTDLTLSAATMIEYYSLRTQIEINFREAKQYFGLRDFKNTKAQRVSFSINLAFMMCCITLILRQGYQKMFALSFVSTEDVKAMERMTVFAEMIISARTNQGKNVFNSHDIRAFAKVEAINL